MSRGGVRIPGKGGEPAGDRGLLRHHRHPGRLRTRLGEDGGGWPGTFDDIAAARDALDGLDDALDLSRVQVGGHHGEVQDRYAQVTPKVTVPLLSIHGTADDVVPAKYTGDAVQVPGANHFDVIDPNHPSWGIVRDWLAERLG